MPLSLFLPGYLNKRYLESQFSWHVGDILLKFTFQSDSVHESSVHSFHQFCYAKYFILYKIGFCKGRKNSSKSYQAF